MKVRRGSSVWPSSYGQSKAIDSFKVGDLVTYVWANSEPFIGVVRDVVPKTNKVYVAWGGGIICQHDPDEIMLEPRQVDLVRQRMASRRSVAGRGLTPRQIYEITKRNLLKTRNEIKRVYPDAALNYSNRQLSGTIEGQDVEIYFDIIHASNGETAGVPVIIVAGKKSRGMFDIVDELQKMIGSKTASRRGRISTAEDEEKPGDEASQVPTDHGIGGVASLKSTSLVSSRRVTFKSGDRLVVVPVALGLRSYYPASKIDSKTVVTVLEDGVSDVYDVMLDDGTEDSIYGFQVQAKVLKPIEREGSRRMREAMYWCCPNRIYRLTRNEQDGAKVCCPRCLASMKLEPFTRSERMWVCRVCGFKVSTGSLISASDVSGLKSRRQTGHKESDSR